MSYPEVKTPALVLNTFPYEEKKLIAHLYTRAVGRAAFVVSGVKRRQYFQRGALLTIRFYHRPQWEVQRLLEAEWLVLYQKFYYEAGRMPYLLLVLEVLNQILFAPDEALFDFIAENLLAIDKASLPREAVRVFLIEMLRRMGGEALPALADWAVIEEHYARLVPNWRPIQTLSVIENLTLPTHDRDH